MTCWEFFNAHFLPVFIYLCIFSVLLLLIIYLVLTRAKIGIDKNHKWFYNYSPFSQNRQNKFLRELIEDYKMDLFKKSFFEESKKRQIGLCNLAIQEIEIYFKENDLNIKKNQEKYTSNAEFKSEYDKKKSYLQFWKTELIKVQNKEWHGDFCGDFETIIKDFCRNSDLR